MIRVLKILLNFKYNFIPPKKNNVLIFDFVSRPMIETLFDINKVEFISTRKEEINLFILTKLIFSFKLNYFDYLLKYIDYVNPKVVITSIDNNKDFYRIKKFKPNITTIFFQNGHRTGANGDIFEILEKKNLTNFKKNYHVDLMCVFNQFTSDQYSKFISGNTFLSGSLKNNNEKIYKKKYNRLVFISLFRPSREPFDRENKLIKTISKFASKNNLQLYILGKHLKKNDKFLENLYFSTILKRGYKFIENFKKRKTYKFLDESKIVVSPGSTMGIESLGRKNKTAIIHSLPKNSIFKKQYWGYYTKREDNGFFWGNDITEINIFRILNNLNHITSANWKKKLKSYKYETCKYDFKNRELKRKIVTFCNKYNFNTTSYLQ